MPLIKSKSKSARSKNIQELIRAFKRSGKIGHSKPGSMAKARKQAVAIAFNQQRRSK